MSEHVPVERDLVVETALRLLPVPDHDERFWERFDAALAAEAPHGEPRPAQTRPLAPVEEVPPARRTDEVPVIELVPTDHRALVPTAVRRRSNAVLSAVAVAAAVVVVVAATSLVRGRAGDDTADLADDATEQADPETTLATLTAPDDEPGAEAVVQWIRALSEGDMATAWDALSPTAQAGWGDQATFEAERTSFAEGYGAWAHTEPEKIFVTPLVSSGEGEIAVITLVGMVEQEGVSNLRADAFPVRIVDGKAELDLSPVSAGIEFVVPAPASGGGHPTVTEDSLIVVVPTEASGTVVRLDGGDVLACGEATGTELTPLDGGYGQRCEYEPEGGLEDGIHVLTAAYLGPDGTSITAQSVVFEAA